MSIKASDLNGEMKQQLLQTLRQKIGDYEYNKIRDSFGEDGIIELLWKQTIKKNSTASNKNNVASTPKSIFSEIFAIIFIGLVWLLIFIEFLLGLERFSLWYGKLLVGFFAPWLFVISLGSISNRQSIFLTILCIIIILASVILVFWGIIQGLISLFTSA